MRLSFIAFLLVLLAAPIAAADPFTSVESHFSADFPAPPQQRGPLDAERDSSGAVISRAMTFAAGRKNLYAATVTVDTFLRPAHLDAQRTLETERDSYVRAGRASLTSSTAGTVGGHPALRFAYENRAAITKGEGLVVIVESETPRIYIVIAERTNNAGSGEIAALDRFVKSFQVID